MESFKSDINFAKLFYVFAFMFLVIYAFNSLNNILIPIAIAFFIWFLINALASQIRKIPYVNNKFLDFIATPLSLIIIIYSMIKIGTFLTTSMMELSSVVSQLDSKINIVIDKISTLTSIDLKEPLSKFFQEFSISSVLNRIFVVFSSIFSNLMQIFLYVLFLLIDQRFFNAKLNALFKKNDSKLRAKNILTSISQGIRTYIFITTVVSLVTGFLTFLICQYFGLEASVLWGFIAFILNFIPTVGTIVAVLIPTIFAFIQIDDLSDILWLFTALVIIQFVIGNIIYPKLMGNKLNISQFVVILSLVVWGAMWGSIGMFLAVPIMMILLIILSQFESTKSLAILISENGDIVRKDAN
ncbi:AI-2E family transporter [Aliarcobacter vitoriensis]|uniref:AI-2E family transporter n=1 Tax=Aliarcobacter vitoriensis TaxID=2011099 RepID=A0A366MP94_9BACT|nr:AI-2E family transporter [Aliarcobacter vitoriensis]RBQ28108.1 AI-2E family transporter [Aliarcobacter vitoriensis]